MIQNNWRSSRDIHLDEDDFQLRSFSRDNDRSRDRRRLSLADDKDDLDGDRLLDFLARFLATSSSCFLCSRILSYSTNKIEKARAHSQVGHSRWKLTLAGDLERVLDLDDRL